MVGVKRALVSVYNKVGIVEFCRELSELGVEIISSGGTAKILSENKIKAIEVSKITEFPEMMDGRVKTLHPKIHGGILADRSKKGHMEEAEKLGIGLIDLVVVNLYPFEETTKKEEVTLGEAIEKIDIGGPTLIRSAAKNYKHVAVVCNQSNYSKVINELKENNNELSLKTREKLALEAFEYISHYDVVIENFLRKEFVGSTYPKYFNLSLKKIQDLRYGENSHQSASFYLDEHIRSPSISYAKQLQGKKLSYNNILDGNSAFEIVKDFGGPTAVVMKHNNPCGVATKNSIEEAYNIAFNEGDPQSAFGGVIALNREVTESLAGELIKPFLEVVIAPGFSKGALEVLSKKRRLRLLDVGNVKFPITRKNYKTFRSVVGGVLIQDADVIDYDKEKLKVVTNCSPTGKEMDDLLYAWRVAKYVVSNSVVYVRDSSTVGVGAGQMKRVDSAKIAGMIASQYNRNLKGSVMASEAFFPFRDGIDAAAEVGVRAIIQPGGSIRDKEVIDACNEYNIAMVFTGIRHFKH